MRLRLISLAAACVAVAAILLSMAAAHIAAAVQPDDMTSTLLIGGSRIDVEMDAGKMQLAQAQLLQWVQRAGEAVATYYGRYPVPRVHIRIIPFDGHGVRHGQTFGYDGGLIKIRVGSETQAAELSDDWMLTHEMVHLSFPSMADEHHWIEEGIATYVEPVARIEAKQMDAQRMWSDLVRDLPKGQPQDGDNGLDHTHTWGRTYWGGALFCFVADVEIRKQTHNQKGLQDALRGILDAGGDIRTDWDLPDALRAGDRATGVSVLSDLYTKWKDQAVTVDLARMWKELGIESDGRTTSFLNDAPMAAIRRAITEEHGLAGTQPAAARRPVAVFAGRSARRSAPVERP